jgi:hypothetical protein
MLPLLREMFPGKLMLTVDDVARVLGRTGAGGYEQTREQLANGVIVPGLKKMGGQWLVPIAALADALDSLVDLDTLGRAIPKSLPTRHTVVSANPVVDRPRRGRVPDRLKAQQARALAFWPAVLARFDAGRLDEAWLGASAHKRELDRF